MEPKAFSHFIRERDIVGLEPLLKSWIETHPHQRLPSVREISLALRISSRDVVAHLEGLRASGRIETRIGSGSWPVGSMPKRLDHAPPSRREASALALELRQDIQDGRFPTGEALPSAKELARDWNCHPRTASRAMGILVDEGLLVREHRGWRIPRPKATGPKQRPKIVLVGADDGSGSLRMDSDREIDFWREVSNEIARNELESSRHFWDGDALHVPAGSIGIIVSTWHHPQSAPLLEAARATRLPVCTWREGLDDTGASQLTLNTRLHLHDVAHSGQAGRDMGRHLLDRSIRSAVWISPFQGASWSKSRETGLREVLDGAGVPVHGFCLDGTSEWDYLGPAWGDGSLRDAFPSSALDALTGGHSRPVFAKAAERRGLHLLVEALEPQLEKALDTDADAWVACNDLVAALVKEWLLRKNAWNPGQRLLAGFDDSSLALRHDLTSYRFDTTAMARSMVLQILTYRPRAQPVRPIRHGGQVVPRGSTSRT